METPTVLEPRSQQRNQNERKQEKEEPGEQKGLLIRVRQNAQPDMLGNRGPFYIIGSLSNGPFCAIILRRCNLEPVGGGGEVAGPPFRVLPCGSSLFFPLVLLSLSGWGFLMSYGSGFSRLCLEIGADWGCVCHVRNSGVRKKYILYFAYSVCSLCSVYSALRTLSCLEEHGGVCRRTEHAVQHKTR